jgi:hypothetical protein
MRPTWLCCMIPFMASTALAQIPNGGFEAWTADPDSNVNPVGWETTNSFPLVSVEPYSPACDGNFALRVKTIDAGFALPGVAQLHMAGAFAKAPTTFSACVKSTIMPGDHSYLIVALMRGDSIIAATGNCTFHIDSTISQFTVMHFPITLQSALLPDSFLVIVASGLGGGQVGTEIIVDNIAFSGGGATEARLPPALASSFVLMQNYPNPFNPTTHIRYQIPDIVFLKLAVYDLLGREVAVLVNETVPAGLHEARFDGEGLASGVYWYRLQAGPFTQSRAMALIR